MALRLADNGDPLMSAYTVFNSMVLHGYIDNVPDAFYAKWVDTFNRQVRYNVAQKLVQTVTLNNLNTRTLVLPGSAVLSSAVFLHIRVIGKVKLTITAKDTNGTTTISGIVRAYGNSILPGLIMLSDYNITTLVLTGEADSTLVEVFEAITEDD